MESVQSISRSVYDPSNQNRPLPHLSIPIDTTATDTTVNTTSEIVGAVSQQGISSPPSSALSPQLGSTTVASLQSPALPTAIAMTHQDHSSKLDALDSSVNAVSAADSVTAATAGMASWPTQYFSGGEVPIGFEQPSPDQLIQQQMLSQSRNPLMQSMATRDMTSVENDVNKQYTFT
ncbi:hypothetical protein BGZ99_000466, partial [Dissophora globulifera]